MHILCTRTPAFASPNLRPASRSTILQLSVLLALSLRPAFFPVYCDALGSLRLRTSVAVVSTAMKGSQVGSHIDNGVFDEKRHVDAMSFMLNP
jgi:hypothetical protein